MMAVMTTAPAERIRARPLREAMAEEIRSLMARRRINGVALAARIGRSQSYVSRRLTGETAFDADDLERIADVLGVQARDLLPPRDLAATIGGDTFKVSKGSRDLQARIVLPAQRSIRPKGRPEAGGTGPSRSERRPGPTRPATLPRTLTPVTSR